MMENLFGDLFSEPKFRTPKNILEEFKNQIEIESSSELTAEIRDGQNGNGNNSFSHMFAIRSVMTNYSYNIFGVSYDVLLYPCIVVSENIIFEEAGLLQDVKQYYTGGFPIQGLSVPSEEQLVKTLTTLMKTSRAKTIVKAIFSQK